MEFVSNSNTQTLKNSNNLYVHFPFCRSKCSYCALYSRAGVSRAERDAYVRRLAREIGSLGSIGERGLDANTARTDPDQTLIGPKLKTIYFGGGSPALCDLSVLAPALRPLCGEGTEFTVELHPLDVTEAKLAELKALGVTRISMGVQSLDDATLADMGRGYTVDEAERAFALVKKHFDNAGIDLIVGYPGDELELGVGVGVGEWREWLFSLSRWGLKHCSVYALQNERGLRNVPDDDAVLDRIKAVAAVLKGMGLERYEISNYAVPGFECRHNLAVWRGEDYIGLGDGAYGRIGLMRTFSTVASFVIGASEHPTIRPRADVVSPSQDQIERRIFRLRTREGLDASGHPEWEASLRKACTEGLLTQSGSVYRLTERGMEVCDSILAELV